MSADPDRFLNFQTPGAQEWWYFDAISDDGRDALVIVWYAGLPFDPEYGVGTLRHLKDPARFPAPKALDHCAIGFSWYRDGKTMAYALNAYRSGDFSCNAQPWTVDVAGNHLIRDSEGYVLDLDTPAVDGVHRINAKLGFRPVAGTEPLERDLGRPDAPHLWILAAADCRVRGRVSIEGPRPMVLDFGGRGYHDHNAGSEELSRSMRRWRWGRVHAGGSTHVYYQAEPRQGRSQSLGITCQNGRPEVIREDVNFDLKAWRYHGFGIRFDRELTTPTFRRRHRRCVDSGPFYLRWLSEFVVPASIEDAPHRSLHRLGLCELLDTRNMHHPLFNWMIPYRLKRPPK